MVHPLMKALARFNGWANTRLYESCARLSDVDYKRDRKAFFGSIHNTLNHVLVVDRLFRGRIEGWKPEIKALDQILHGDFDALRAARVAEDTAIVRMVDGLDPKRLAQPLKYAFMDGTPAQTQLDVVLVTMFNHQTHHRGQVHAMLTQAGIKPAPMDIIDYEMSGGRA
jgi:uncharacterized damage-inducible protein DinB